MSDLNLFRGYRERDIEALKARLKSLVPLLRRKYVYKALRKGAEVVQKKATQVPSVMPVLARPIYRKGKLIRKPGTLRDNVVIRSSRDATREGNVGVFVNVKPAKGAARGTYSPDDPYYWRWVVFATKRNRNPRPFLQIGGNELQGEALRAIETSLAPDLQQLNLFEGPR